MYLIREVAPNDMPIVVQGQLGKDGLVDPDSISVFPLMDDGTGNVFIMAKLPMKMNGLAARLNNVTKTMK